MIIIRSFKKLILQAQCRLDEAATQTDESGEETYENMLKETKTKHLGTHVELFSKTITAIAFPNLVTWSLTPIAASKDTLEHT